MLVMFRQGRISLSNSLNTYFTGIYLFLAYGASLQHVDAALITWNLSITLTVLVWPTVIIAVSFRKVLILNYMFIIVYLIFFELNQVYNFRELAFYGGFFLLITALVAPYLATIRLNALKRNARLRFDLKKVNQKLKATNDQLAELNASKDKFFSIISHDLRTPFNSLLGMTTLLKDDSEIDCKETREYAEMIHQSASNAYDLLSNLLDWSRSSMGRIRFEPEELLLPSIITEVFESLSHAANHKSIDLKSDIRSDAIVHADKNMVSTILRNLVSNAIKFTPSGGEVTVSVSDVESGVNVSVNDTGVGIPASRLTTLFDISEMKSTLGTDNERGTGLGLILCKEFAERHGGRISVESTLAQGSTFTLFLPNSSTTPV
jgi:signal transduction histidine kinase